jgi:hypothetical protein
MSSRSTRYVCGRPKVLFPALFGLGLLIGGVSLFWGFGLIGFAVYQASKLLKNPRLDHLLRLRADKESHGIRRMLTAGERREVIAIDEYCKELTDSGADPTLASDVLDQAWSMIRDNGARDSTVDLRLFREKLPRVAGDTETPEGKLSSRIERELHIIHATQKEMESLGNA